MSETKTDYSIGHLRMQFLTEANEMYARAQSMMDFRMCDRMLDNFLSTIKEESKAAQFFNKEMNIVSLKKRESISELDRARENMGYLENKEADIERDRIEVSSIADKRLTCWRVALKEGLFYE